ncbi:hypothetical protein JCGZ_26834 [Jatropha curcas]|uniref:NAC transcription factor 060 n=1 Tax=Jatropha curcas TaxID=180498 RepID=R4NEW4_JATCU|nr:NAC domain-containing protein 83 [Jatropha curcas]AGL39716.1 NAC transcription factor 060 [Jatropha curcas]KDP41816.1 hypothetical protein JCGZ_26834 [Jatropha curcas]
MEKTNFAVKLPIGYRFHPTDEELLVHYLRRKVFGVPLPASVIPDFDVFQTDPWTLPGDLKEKRYFFSRKWGSDSENYRCKRAAGSGYWKPISKSRQIIASLSNYVIGVRTTLIFHQGNKHSNNYYDSKTQWVMHEYRLVGSGTIPNTKQVSKMKLGDWVVYRVFQRKRRPKKERIVISKPSSSSKLQTTMEERSDIVGPSQPCSPCCSGVTTDEGGLDQEETNSSCNSFSNFHYCVRKN